MRRCKALSDDVVKNPSKSRSMNLKIYSRSEGNRFCKIRRLGRKKYGNQV
jgi:hypothetical protein